LKISGIKIWILWLKFLFFKIIWKKQAIISLQVHKN
jgi:hypothetical protein